MLLIIQCLALWRKNYVMNSNTVEFLIKKGIFSYYFRCFIAVKTIIIVFLLDNRWFSLISSCFRALVIHMQENREENKNIVKGSYYMYGRKWKCTIYLVFTFLSNSSVFSDTEIKRGRVVELFSSLNLSSCTQAQLGKGILNIDVVKQTYMNPI